MSACFRCRPRATGEESNAVVAVGDDPPQQLLELVEFLGGEAGQVIVVHRGQVMRNLRRQLAALVGEREFHHAPVGGAARARQEALGFEPVEHA